MIHALMGEVLVFTPKRLGHAFEKDRWFAMGEGGKWGHIGRVFADAAVYECQVLVASGQGAPDDVG